MGLTFLDISGASTMHDRCEKQAIAVVLRVVWMSDNNIGEEGAKALGPHLAKLVNMNALGLNGRKRGWDVCVCVRGGCLVVLLWL